MGLDVQAIRKQFPALAEGAAHFDGPGGTQVPQVVADAVADALTSAISNRGEVTASERRADDIVRAARAAMGDLLGVDPRGVVFGRSMTQLTYDFSRTLAKTWTPGDEVVVTTLDHDANIRPWVQAATAVGAALRWAEFDPSTGELSADAVAAVVSERTRLVAVSAASNLIGTKPPVREIADVAHAAGALLYVDGVHYTAHCFVDVPELGADFFACSPYKFCGPHLGALAARPQLLETVTPDKLLPSTDEVPDRFEFGTLPYELLAGTTAAVDFLAGLAPGEGTRRDRLHTSMTAVEAHEDSLRRRMEDRLAQLDGVVIYSRAAHRTPTLLLTVDGHSPDDVYAHLATLGVNAPASSFYAIEPSRALGLGAAGGVRLGLAPYTDDSDVDRVLAGIEELT
ncbi:MAG TPA: cysteine desulfurase-like protein [Jatrophihabitantaceae bacterium]|nr:cysteine desulfurase-like protein [Jatrophihabitantaceae bacterium]